MTIDPATSEVTELMPYVGAFSARTAKIRRNVDRYEAEWRGEHPGEKPGPRLQEAWDRRAWAEARPDKVVPSDGRELVERWNHELRELGYRDPAGAVLLRGTQPGWIDRDAAAGLIVSMLGSKASAWNEADIRGKTEVLLAQTCLLADSGVRVELAEDITARAVDRCHRLVAGTGIPEGVRSLSSTHVLDVEADLIARLFRRATQPATRARIGTRGIDRSDPTQAAVVGLAGGGELIVVDGAAAAGKTTALRTTRPSSRDTGIGSWS